MKRMTAYFLLTFVCRTEIAIIRAEYFLSKTFH
jgi:hypothetical protein